MLPSDRTCLSDSSGATQSDEVDQVDAPAVIPWRRQDQTKPGQLDPPTSDDCDSASAHVLKVSNQWDSRATRSTGWRRDGSGASTDFSGNRIPGSELLLPIADRKTIERRRLRIDKRRERSSDVSEA